MQLKCLLLFVLIGSWMNLFAQEGDPEEQRFTIDTPASLDFKKEEDPVSDKKKKKVKKKVYYGIKTKKAFTRKGQGDRVTYELFYVLKTPEKPQTFVRDIYWYDYTRHEIRKTTTFDPSKGILLHGPYEKRQGDVVWKKEFFTRVPATDAG